MLSSEPGDAAGLGATPVVPEVGRFPRAWEKAGAQGSPLLTELPGPAEE